jgi:hypothetical protein
MARVEEGEVSTVRGLSVEEPQVQLCLPIIGDDGCSCDSLIVGMDSRVAPTEVSCTNHGAPKKKVVDYHANTQSSVAPETESVDQRLPGSRTVDQNRFNEWDSLIVCGP